MDNNYNTNSDDRILLESFMAFSKKYIKPQAKDIDANNHMDRNLWKLMGDHGLLGITVPSEYGGANMNYYSHCLAIQAISWASGSVGLSYAAHSNLCINQIVKHANISQKHKFLPKLVSGDNIGAIAISENSYGSDALGLQLMAKEDKNNYILNGNKIWITNGPEADVIIVYARTSNSSKKSYGITAFIVTKDMTGLRKMPKIDKLGMRGSNTCELAFDNVIVPKENIIGEINQASKILFSGLDCERILLAAGPIGIMQAALDIAIEYSRSRNQFGNPIGSYQLIQAKLADMYTALRSSSAFLYSIALKLDQGTAKTEEAASVILLAAENATKVCLDAIQILGGNGYTKAYEVERLLRDAKLYEIGAGTSEIRRIIIGKKLFQG